MRLIDADAVPKLFEKKYEETEQRILDGERYLDTLAEGFTEADDVILSMPTIEAEPVKHGQWRIVFDAYDCEMMECSCCGAEFYDGDNDTVDCLHNYCPNCGAKMDLEE